ncbi:MAG: polyprenyl diphosphate synthase [Candidatus Margulisiibacteriota bacterium]|nr:polyprenyl diphosphate synthase [Candidatus Margulisiibacteriota bacterium]
MSADDSLTNKYGIDLTRVPQHIAIIMDGNGRWAKKRLMPRNFGHRQGQKQLKKTLINCVKLGVKYLSVYVFSTENWRRPDEEVSFLLKFLKSTIQDELNELISEGVRLKFLGDLSQFDQSLLDMISDSEFKTNDNTNIQLNVMLNYGGRREIIDAVKIYVKNGGDIDSLTEDNLQPCLYTEGIPDPDILIRTGGDLRISNFMLWQAAYSEFFFLDVFWPEFDFEELVKVIGEFQSRDRRFGGLNE